MELMDYKQNEPRPRIEWTKEAIAETLRANDVPKEVLTIIRKNLTSETHRIGLVEMPKPNTRKKYYSLNIPKMSVITQKDYDAVFPSDAAEMWRATYKDPKTGVVMNRNAYVKGGKCFWSKNLIISTEDPNLTLIERLDFEEVGNGPDDIGVPKAEPPKADDHQEGH
jgi:hypothetical protein